MLDLIITVAGIGAGLMALVWLVAFVYMGWLVIKRFTGRY